MERTVAATTKNKNQSACKALEIIEYMALNDNEPMRLGDLAQGLKMNASTVLRYLTALADCGYVQQSPKTLRYSLTLKLCSLAGRISANVELYNIALPYMKQASAVFGESCCIGVERDASVVYLGVVEGPAQMRITQRIGSRAPMYCTGIGKLLLTEYDPAAVRRLADAGMTPFTEHTLDSSEALLAQVEAARTQGYAIDNEECEIGMRCVAVPVYNYTGHIIAGMSVTGPAVRMSMEIIAEKLPQFKGIAAALSRDLGYLES